ncbi:helix-turn-helix domain-containing protein [Nostoc sp. NZL]|uniref:helix-turn-helix domain-containing protein n=1 Tax=Nostoc sp. NZL TaxID=2650612 RepID=UPI0018C6C294|nr:AraC family transcriptional regulator [Nostoc sp. NZL]MBG1240258.1 helix-turn-helix transcriptional regulator [Nostoc sp. NZL]
MAVTISQQAYNELCDENVNNVGKFDTDDDLDNIYKYPQQLGQGYSRIIELRQGLELAINKYHLHNQLITQAIERKHPLEYTFYLSGGYTDKFKSLTIGAGEYGLYGSGIAPKEHCEWSAAQQLVEINVHIEPEIFCSFIGDKSGQLSPELQHLVKGGDSTYYTKSGVTTPAMQTALQQILHCPYHGITKRMYLEAKVIELMALLVEQEVEAQKGETQTYPVKSDDLERIHHAREILLRNLDNPPSLVELSRQVGLNECTLKRGFRLVFGTTAFHYLHNYRLEKAQQLLHTGDMNVVEVSRIVGFASRSYFAAAFRKKFGLNPKEYLTNRKNSL